MTRTSILLAALLAASLTLSACGLKGDLVTPSGDGAPAVQRSLPNTGNGATDRIVFTRDDVDLFREDATPEDPFAEEQAPPASDGAEGAPPLPPG